MKRISLRSGLGILAAITILLILVVIAILQIYWTNTLVIDQAQNRVKQHINSAWQTIEDHSAKLSMISYFLAEMLMPGMPPANDLQRLLTHERQGWQLDFLCLLDDSGETVTGSKKRLPSILFRQFLPSGLP